MLTKWDSKEAFKNWVHSDLFKRSHSRDRAEGQLAHGNELRVYEVLDGGGAGVRAIRRLALARVRARRRGRGRARSGSSR